MPTTTELETLVSRLVGDNRLLIAALKECEREYAALERAVERTQKNTDDAFSKMGRGALGVVASVVGIGGAVQTVFSSVKLAAGAELLTTSFEVLLGSAEQAKKTLADIRAFAVETPFQSPEIIEAAKMMTAFGEEADNLIPTMRLLGEVSSGLQVPLKELTYLYATLKAQGRAYTVDIRQFASRGIPIYLELAKALGLVDSRAKKLDKETYSQLDKLIEKGAVDFELVQKAFQNMTGPGGQFFGQLEAQSKTLTGLFSTMKEEVELTMTAIGQAIVRDLNLKEVVKQVSVVARAFNVWLENLSPRVRQAIATVAVLVVTFGALAAAVTLAGTVGGVGIIVGLIGTGLVAATVAYADSVGGIEEAWKRVKRTVEEFWEFVGPALPALGFLLLATSGPLSVVIGLVVLLVAYWDDVVEGVQTFWREGRPVFRAAWELFKAIAFTVRDGLVDGFNQLKRLAGGTLGFLALLAQEVAVDLGKMAKELGLFTQLFPDVEKLVRRVSNVSWRDLRNGLRDFIFYAEFAWRNFGDYARLGMYYAMLGWESLTEDIKHLFTGVLPTALNWMLKNWEAVFSAMWKIAKSLVENFMDLLVKGISSTADIVSGKIKLSDLINDQAKKFQKETQDALNMVVAPEFKVRPTTELEQTYTDVIKMLKKDLEVGFESFRKKKLDKFVLEDLADSLEAGTRVLLDVQFGQAEATAARAGADAGAAYSKEFGRAVKFDAALFGSQEARARIEEYQTTFPDDVRNRFPPAAPVDLQPRNVVLASPPPPNTAEQAMVDLLKLLLESSIEIQKKPPVVMAPANIE